MRIRGWSSDVGSSELPRNPWGNEPPRGPGRGNRPSNVDFESLIRKGQERLRSSIPGGGGDPRRMWLMIAGGLIALWIVFGSFYRVDPQERGVVMRSEEHTSDLQSLMRISYAVFCLKKKKNIDQ